MAVIAVLVISIDGKLTKGDDPNVDWTSQEDKNHFKKIKAQAKCIVYGSTTYEIGKSNLSPDQRILVHTRTPQNYNSDNQKVTFTDKSPADAVAMLKGEGYEDIYVLGGGKIYSMYIVEKAADQVWMTLEPKMFGKGVNFFETENVVEVDFKLIDVSNLNDNTLLLKYNIKK